MISKKMTPANQGENAKIAALIGAIVLVGIFGYWRIHSELTPQPSQQPPSIAAVPVPTTVATAASQPDDEELISVPMHATSTVTDPFRNVLTAVVMTKPAAEAPKPKRAFRPSRVTAYLPDAAALPGVFRTQIAPVELPKLKGILEGVAVLTVEGKESVVRPGDRVGDGYVVTHVGGREVVLAKGTTRTVLRLDR